MARAIYNCLEYKFKLRIIGTAGLIGMIPLFMGYQGLVEVLMLIELLSNRRKME